jgi:hypothetical protein
MLSWLRNKWFYVRATFQDWWRSLTLKWELLKEWFRLHVL